MTDIQQLIVPLLLVFLAGYLLGSISFAVLVTKHFKQTDVRSIGSGNAGTTNVMRAAGIGPALLTFFLDFGKCACAVALGHYVLLHTCLYLPLPTFLAVFGKYSAGVGCIIGHLYPIFFGFRGGKGVAAAAGLIFMLDWRVFLPTLLTFILLMFLTRIVSLSSIVGLTCYPLYTFLITYFFDYRGGQTTVTMAQIVVISLCAAGISAIVIAKHKENIKRLLHHEEKPLSFSNKKRQGP